MNTTDSTAETLPKPQEPNPYRFTVEVTAGRRRCWVDLKDAPYSIIRSWLFDTKEEADTHAALILAALHQAVME